MSDDLIELLWCCSLNGWVDDHGGEDGHHHPVCQQEWVR